MPLTEVFDGRSQLITYYLMWHTGKPTAEQCEGCTFNTAQVNELSYLNSRDVNYATFCQGPYEESSRYRDFMGWTFLWYSVPEDSVNALVGDPNAGFMVCYLRDGDKVYETYRNAARGNEVMGSSYLMMDLTAFGRRESWEDSPEGWPQDWSSGGGQMSIDGRPIAQWPRIKAGRDDDLGNGAR